jgi:hypothetical protein
MLSAIMPSFWVVILGFGCPPPDETGAGNDTATVAPRPVTCETEVVPTEPCLVAADGSGTYTTIQAAVDVAHEGDVITVCPGYYDSVVIENVGVTLQGYGADNTCIIGDTGSGITIAGVDVEISGLTVSGNAADPGAISANSASGKIHDVRIAGVDAASAGTGVEILTAVTAEDSELSWDNLVVEQNDVVVAMYAFGGRQVIRHSILRDNGGDGLLLHDGTVEVTNCIFSNNNGVGLYATDSSSYVVMEGTLANNVFYRHPTTAMFLEDSAEGRLQVHNNVALSNAHGFDGWPSDMDYNVSWDNSEDWPVGGGNNEHDVVIDPLFVDPAAGDFRLQSASPLIAAGDPDPGYNDADGTRNDIGAFGGPYGTWTPG